MIENKELEFPHYIILKASAGSGKTTVLTKRYVSFLLSSHIPFGGIRKILAITFSNNAAYEMKSRILTWLKDLYFKNTEAIQNFSEILSLNEDELSTSAERILEEIINNYSDFQVKTIDSFMTSIFKASAIDFDYAPDFEIIMNNEFFMNYAYDLFLKDIEEGFPKAEFFKEIIDKISPFRDSFIWDPADDVLKKLKDLHNVISSTIKQFDFQILDEEIEKIQNEIAQKMNLLIREVASSGLERNSNNRIFDSFSYILKTGNFKELIEKGITVPPVKKPKDKNLLRNYEYLINLWEEFKVVVEKYVYLYSRSYYSSYLKIFRDFEERLRRVKQKEAKIFIEDINKSLSGYINASVVPDIYFRLGDKIHHFFIDEFQDTSPLQWVNLTPLIENALSEGGSLFVVGDTKQAIYSFRGADYRIMRELEKKNVFPSAIKLVKELNINYRSKGKILEFVDVFFKEKIKEKDIYAEASYLTGISSYEQISKEGAEHEGYVEIAPFYVEDEESDEKIKDYLKRTIEDAKTRGYALKDMAILAFKNEQVVGISAILNELKFPFISYSSLDVRKRKVTVEILNMLKFLDSPIDDFSFSVFLLGDLYRRFIAHTEKVEEEAFLRQIEQFLLKYRENSPLYKYFQKEFSQRWERDFQKLFKLTGYLPLYDLITAILNNLRAFEVMHEEEATFLKLLEIVSVFESRGLGSIKDFIEFVSSPGDDEKVWNLSLGSDIDALQVMTIHKAKGLGFPVVIIFLEDLREKVDDYVIYESEGSNSIYIFKINNEMAKKSEILNEIKTWKKLSNTADTLNTLYVAFTRAQEELYIACKVKKESSFPFDVLKQFFGEKYGNKSSKPSLEIKDIRTISTEYDISEIDFPVVTEKIHLKEKERGDFIHRLLAEIEYFHEGLMEELSLKIEEISREMKKEVDSFEIKETLMNLFRNEEISKFFISFPDRLVFNEFEVVDGNGLVHRLDRVVIDPDKLTVIEYKTGHPSEEHKEQLKLYLKLISQIYEKLKVQGCLYYLDLGEIRWS